MQFLEKANGVLGVIRTGEETLDAEIRQRIAEREAARKAKNWAEADRIRKELLAKGVVLEDMPGGVVGTRKSNS
jgi:cysteinyl-tRNA synthetase